MTDTAAPPERALTAAYTELRRGLLASIRYKISDAQLAEDLLQEVFLKALRAVREGRAPGNLAAWLHQVVRTTVVDHYRASAKRHEALDDEALAAVPADEADGELLRFQALAHCMEPLAAALPPLYRDALVAADLQGQPLAALAQGVSLSAIKSRVSRARAMLREQLLQCCNVERSPSGAVQDFQAVDASRCACRDKDSAP